MMTQGGFFIRLDVSKQRFDLWLDAGGTSLSIENSAKGLPPRVGSPSLSTPKPSPWTLPAAMIGRAANL